MLLVRCRQDGGVLKMLRRLETAIRRSGMAAVAGLLLAAAPGFGQRLENQALSLAANQQDGSYELGTRAGRTHPVLRARVGAEVDHQWIFANEYPRHRSSQSSFNDLLGTGREVAMTCSGLDGKPDLTYRLQLYDGLPYGTIQVEVQNRTAKNVTVQAIRLHAADSLHRHIFRCPVLNLHLNRAVRQSVVKLQPIGQIGLAIQARTCHGNLAPGAEKIVEGRLRGSMPGILIRKDPLVIDFGTDAGPQHRMRSSGARAKFV